MTRLVPFLAVLALLAAVPADANILNAVIEAVFAAASSKCDVLKDFFKLSYDAFKDQDLDTSKLQLDFITSSVTRTYYLTEAAAAIPQSGWFNHSHPLHIYLHGFTDNPTKESFTTLAKSFLEQGDCNIIALDASSMIQWLYLRSSTMVRFIGEELAGVLVALCQDGFDPSKIHLIGHSLGSHIAAFTGKKFIELTGEKVRRISGLDPAGPCFTDVDDNLKLSSSDAEFVDVIHTDAGVYGLKQNVGHVDFYPDGGTEQPNCMSNSCCHGRAWEYYAESVINHNAFIGVSCESWTQFKEGTCDTSDTSVMGYACPEGTTGTYYLQTSGESPYGLGTEGLECNN